MVKYYTYIWHPGLFEKPCVLTQTVGIWPECWKVFREIEMLIGNQKKREAWWMALLPTKGEMETLQVQQMISCPSVKIPGAARSKESSCQCRMLGFNAWVRKISWKRKWQLTPVFLHGESHGQGRLMCCSPWGRKESDMTEQLNWTEHNFQQYVRYRKAQLCRGSS